MTFGDGKKGCKNSETVLLCWQIPDERLLLETDAPDGRPKADEEQLADLKAAEDDSSTMNHPANIRYLRG